MLEQSDLKQIKEIVQEVVKESEDRVITAVGEMVEQQILPRLDNLEQEMGRLKVEVAALRKDVTRLDSQMVTKQYLDDKLADEFSSFYERLKRDWFSKDAQWKKRTMSILEKAKIASPEDLSYLEALIGV